MRIGIFTESWTPYISGLVTSEVMLKNALEKLGHEVYVVTANLESFTYEYNEKERIYRIPGIPTGIYDSRLTGIYPIKAIKKIKEWDLDVIHSQTEFAIGTFARIFAKQYDIPIVHTYHTMYEDYVHYITKGYFDAPSKKIVEYLTKFYCDKTIDELIVPTKKTYDLFKEKYRYERNVHIIPTGIEIERFYKEKINQVDLFRIFLSSYNYGTDPFDLTDDEVYQTIENMNLLEIESRQPDKILTHRDYSRYISKLLNYNDIAKMNDIFKDKYDDITSEDSDYGYLFLGDIKGLIESEDNKLMPDKEIDRETALYYFYNLKLID